MSLSGLAGWIGMVLLAISFCTPVRNSRLSSMLGGYRSQLQIHHWFGILAVVSMLVHLGFLLWEYSSSPAPLFDLLDPTISAGWFAFAGTSLVVAAALWFRSAPYRRWRQVHLMLLLGFSFAVWHSYLVLEPATFSEWALIAGVSLVGLAGYVWSLLISRSPFFGSDYTIDQQKPLLSDLFSLVLKPSQGTRAVQFKAGHFLFLRFMPPKFSPMWHPFTVVRFLPDSGELELLIKARGRDTNLLAELTTPSAVKVNGPFGVEFWSSREPQLWIAFGVGIAIFLAAARAMPEDFGSELHLVYCEKSRDRLVFGTEFDELSIRRRNFSWSQYYGEGREVLVEVAGKTDEWARRYRLFRICGHPGFQAAAKKLLVAARVPKNRIILEGVY